jgi:hypothetical protein
MAELKKTPMNSVHEDIISMEFDENPNIPTANYNSDTEASIQQAIINKMKVDKLKKFIDSELKRDNKPDNSGESIGLSFSFKGM